MEEALYINSDRILNATKTTYFRYLYNEIDWEDRLIGITGPRGTGKTTMLLQHIKYTSTIQILPTALLHALLTKEV